MNNSPEQSSLLPLESQPSSFYKTSALDLATSLVMSGSRLAGTERDGTKAIFIFHHDDQIAITVADFFAGRLRLEPRTFVEVWKNLRTLTFSVTGNVRIK